MANSFIKLLEENPAEFPFGLIGIPMALAVQSIAERFKSQADPISFQTLFSIMALLVVQFAYAMSISVYVLDRSVELWEKRPLRFLTGVIGVMAFAMLLLLEVTLPNTVSGLSLLPLQIWTLFCFADLAFLWIPFVTLPRTNPDNLHLAVFVLMALAIFTLTSFLWF